MLRRVKRRKRSLHNRDTMRLRVDMDKGLNKKLDGLSETSERLQGEVFDLKQENTRLNAELHLSLIHI